MAGSIRPLAPKTPGACIHPRHVTAVTRTYTGIRSRSDPSSPYPGLELGHADLNTLPQAIPGRAICRSFP